MKHDQPKDYTKLSKSSGIGGYYMLYACDDHLVAIERNISERYRRFYYKDIQAVVARVTYGNRAYVTLYGLLTALFFYFVYTSRDSVGGMIFLGIITAIFLFGMLYNLYLGTTCECRIKTAVQYERIGAVNRIYKAQNLVGFLDDKIAYAQQGLIAKEPPSEDEGIDDVGTEPTEEQRTVVEES